jgi:hypothetical protein
MQAPQNGHGFSFSLLAMAQTPLRFVLFDELSRETGAPTAPAFELLSIPLGAGHH